MFLAFMIGNINLYYITLLTNYTKHRYTKYFFANSLFDILHEWNQIPTHHYYSHQRTGEIIFSCTLKLQGKLILFINSA